MRLTLVGGVVFLALLLLLATCGGDPEGEKKDSGATASAAKPVLPSAGPVTRLTVPPQYTTDRGWEIIGSSPMSPSPTPRACWPIWSGRGEPRYRLRTVGTATGELGWRGQAWQPPDPLHYPKLATVAKGDRQFFVTWSYGKVGDGLSPEDTFLALDLYDVTNGNRQRVEVPWSGPRR